MSTETTLAARLAEDAAERFLRYVRIDTRSDEESETYPSTHGQLDLLRLLRDELEQIGLADVAMDEHGYVTGDAPGDRRARGADDRVLRPRRHRARGERRRRLAAARALRGRRDRARRLGPVDPPERVAGAREPRRPRADHDRRDDAPRGRRQGRRRRDHGRGRAISSRSRRSRTGRSRSRSTPTRRSAAASSTSRSRASAPRPRTPSTARPPASCRPRRSPARRCACASAAARSIPAGRRASS